MKKIKILLILSVVVLLLTSLFACNLINNNPDDTQPAQAGEMTLVVGETVYTVDLEKVNTEGKGLYRILEYLKETEGLVVESQTGDYGTFLTRVGDVISDSPNGIYVAIYTSVEHDFDVSAWAQTITWNDVTLTTSGFGADSMTIEDGCTILIKQGSY